MEINFVIGDRVSKKSGKPFLNGEKFEIIAGFGINEHDPKKRPCVIFSNGSVCNIDLLNQKEA